MTVNPIGKLRSMLFAPAVRPDFIQKLAARGADAVVIDCEDATPPNAKAEARTNAKEGAPAIAGQGTLVFVRVNAFSSEWFADDIRSALCPELTGIVLPKADRVEHLHAARTALAEAGFAHLSVVAGIETALGVADSRALLACPGVGAAYFGAEDFTADMGGQRTESNDEVRYARSKVALSGRLAGIPMLDQVVVDFRNADAFEREVKEARALGYRGKLCIHPDQVALANRGFLPSEEEVDFARRLLEAFDRASAAGIAAIDFEGQMVDEPLAARARQTLASMEGSEG